MGAANAENAPASKSAVRVWAWALGGLSFLAPLGVLGLSPKPVAAQSGATTSPAAKPKRPVIIIVTRKKIIQDAPKPSVVSSGGGGVSYVYAPSTAAAPVAASCGTHPC